MNRLWIVLLGGLASGGVALLVFFVIPSDPVPDEMEAQTEPSSMAATELDEKPPEKASRKPARRWTGPPEEHPAARVRKNRMEKGRFGIPPRKRRGEAARRRPLWDQEFGRATLIRAGYGAEEIERLEALYEDNRDRVLSELGLGPYGGGAQPGFAEESRARDAMADLVGDVDDYDALLFATGQPNRVEVKEVMRLGRIHGLQPGDIFWEYNGDRIFPHDGYLTRMRADQAQGLQQPVVFYRPEVGFFSVFMQPEKQGWGVVTQPVNRVPGQETQVAED